MKIRVLFFAGLREKLGEPGTLELPDGLSVGEAAARLTAGAGELPPLLYAVNENFEPAARPLADGDVLAILTPMSGG